MSKNGNSWNPPQQNWKIISGTFQNIGLQDLSEPLPRSNHVFHLQKNVWNVWKALYDKAIKAVDRIGFELK